MTQLHKMPINPIVLVPIYFSGNEENGNGDNADDFGASESAGYDCDEDNGQGNGADGRAAAAAAAERTTEEIAQLSETMASNDASDATSNEVAWKELLAPAQAVGGNNGPESPLDQEGKS